MRVHHAALLTFVSALIVGATAASTFGAQVQPYSYSPTRADPAVARTLLAEHQRLLARIGPARLETMG